MIAGKVMSTDELDSSLEVTGMQTDAQLNFPTV